MGKSHLNLLTDAEDSSFVSASMKLSSSGVSKLEVPEAKATPVHDVSENDVAVAEEGEGNKIVVRQTI